MSNDKMRSEFEAWLGEVNDTFSYDEISGNITIKTPYHMNPVGKIIGYGAGQGYLKSCFKKQHFLIHRMAWFLFIGKWPENMIDHKNGIRSDNRIENLREATHFQNCQNAKTPSTNTTGIKGVSFNKSKKTYFAYITINNRFTSIGNYKTIEEATFARRKFAEKLYGEFANHG